MNYRVEASNTSRATVFVAFITLLTAMSVPMSAQEGSVRAGLNAGMQSSIMRYSMYPFVGEFQSTVDEGAVVGVVFVFDMNRNWGIQFEATWNNANFSVQRGEDPRTALSMENRTLLEFPVLLRFDPGFEVIPVYIAAGPVLTVVSNPERRFAATWFGFTEREGWRSWSRVYDDDMTSLRLAAEVGVDATSGCCSFLASARFQHPLSRAVHDDFLSVRFLSIWRLQMTVLVRL